MAKKRKFLPYEGPKFNDRHLRITHSMLKSEKFINLSSSAKVLYFYMKDWAVGKMEFEYQQKLAKNSIFHSSSTFESAKKELINNGFIEVVRQSKCSRIPNLYRFSDKWYK